MGNYLSGTLSTTVGQMSSLIVLDLGDVRYLSGPLPTEIGLLTALQELYTLLPILPPTTLTHFTAMSKERRLVVNFRAKSGC